mgnify:FL=1
MTTPDTIAVEFALTHHHSTKSDATIATELRVPAEEVAALRLSLGLTTPLKKQSLKEDARQYIVDMSPQEKLEFFKGIAPYKLWTMAEGAPDTKIDVTQEPIRIDISHQLRQIYGPRIITQLPEGSEGSELPGGSDK